MNCTIVSMYPVEVFEKKNGLYPGEFRIPASKGSMPGVLVVGKSKHYIQGQDGMPAITVEHDAEKMATSIVNDFVFDKSIAVSAGTRQPAIFYVEGTLTAAEAVTKCADKINSYKEMQKLWFIELVKLADDTWAKNPGRHKLIVEDARIAARELNLERPWVMESEEIKVNCKFCKVPVDQDALICYNCKSDLKKPAIGK